MKVLCVFGTRPEAIKMAPVVNAIARDSAVTGVTCVTGQHRAMLDQVLDLFDITPDYDLAVMAPNQTLNSLSCRVIAGLDAVLEEVRPDCVLVHGDTTSAMAASLAAFHRGIKIGHVEAGLRTYDLSRPWPEEMNRRVIDVVSSLSFAPTASSAENLEREHLGGRIIVTGNTVIDALKETAGRIGEDASLRHRLEARFTFLNPGRRLVLVTGHRRESFGGGFVNICKALARLAERDDVDIVYPVHLNPNVSGPVRELLGTLDNVHLIDPLAYLDFVYLMTRSDIILTDSGGVQEEAPSLGKPVLVMRDVTERPEAVAAGAVILVGTEAERIVTETERLLDDAAHYQGFSRVINPYGDGKAARRIADALAGRPVSPFDTKAAQ
ncbi:UDP-N-acetylglucosamine 2-epimerase (non-hydrolyzing) [Martelella lutilitoris]|uniref:UDP-N-acetylglucosamine 2-epimerase (non-hydrolyzing) n=1 Tax=Martelella lutilitoris TaxID=2583532 RepID=A0A7T7KLP7_9HYPH|nr:UDP-N-acetylglucosamine 2-epimerase (non-hydrolyzing) [Martelella lutilitoris]QQM30977.1 UDP-N-acetylglucosamine 2-epimerase (non-hydrolyzing) [Martelella lutilitoris]